MHYLTISFTHKNTDIKIREKLSFADDTKRFNFLERLQKIECINESIILSTCNRVEIITSTMGCDESTACIFNELEMISGFAKDELQSRADVYEDNGAIHHLFSVASSLDSLVIGETQIVGQLKDAFKFSTENGFCGQKLSRAMHHMFRCAASVRASTQISKNPISVSSVAVSQAKDLLGSLVGTTALLVGAGEMSTLAGKHLIGNGAKVIILNRSRERAEILSQELGELASVGDFTKLRDYINEHSLLFSATGAPDPIINKDMTEERDFERYWFDIAVPRDIEDFDMDRVSIYAVDDLEEIVIKNLAGREDEARVAYKIVSNSTIDFFKWLQTLSIDPIIKELRDKARECSQKEIDRAVKKGYIPAEHKESLQKILHSAFNAFLHTPTKNLKSFAEEAESDTIVQSIQKIFDMDQEQVKRINTYKCEYQMEND